MNKRRDFLKSLALLTSGILVSDRLIAGAAMTNDSLGQVLPYRMLGNTGEKVTMLGLGGYHVGWTTEKDAREVIETAVEGGIRFFDTAESYDDGGSETRYGKYLVPKYRDQVFIMTKSTARDGKTAKEHLEGSLKRMNCDYIDLWQIHSIRTPEDVDNRLENEVLDVFEKAKDEGKVRHIGFTGHRNPYAHKQMLDRTKSNNSFATVQMPVNVIDPHWYSFTENVLKESLNRNLGILAMKTLSDGRFFAEKRRLDKIQYTTENPIIPDAISIKDALYYVWSLPVSVLITGAENKTLLEEKIELAKNFTALSEEQRTSLVDRVAEYAGNKVEYYKKV
jgi:aryl-alcohol dehydrogenase-like predicted oxidoreductase